MNRWTRIVFAVAGLGIAGWCLAGWNGRALAAQGGEPGLHALLAFVSTLTLLFADVWLVVYLVALARALRAAGATTAARPPVAVLVAAAVAIAATVCQFSVAGALYPGQLPGRLHGLLALLALAAQAALLVLSARALRRGVGAVPSDGSAAAAW